MAHIHSAEHVSEEVSYFPTAADFHQFCHVEAKALQKLQSGRDADVEEAMNLCRGIFTSTAWKKDCTWKEGWCTNHISSLLLVDRVARKLEKGRHFQKAIMLRVICLQSVDSCKAWRSIMPRILLSSQTLVHLENPEFLPEHSLDNIEKCYDRIREEEIKLKMWTSPKERKELQLQIYDFALQCVRKGDLRLGFKHLGISIAVANRPSLDAEERRASHSAKTLRLVMLLESPAAQGEEGGVRGKEQLPEIETMFDQDAVSASNGGGIDEYSKPHSGEKEEKDKETEPSKAPTISGRSSEVEPKVGPRPIVIDGSNVAFAHGRLKAVSLNKERAFSAKGIQIVVEHFRAIGHNKIVAFVPQHQKRAGQTEDPAVLEQLEREGIIFLTPSRVVDGKRITPYDDGYILDYAAKHGGVVITGDNYRDLMTGSFSKPEWKQVVKERILTPTFVGDEVMWPNDPLGERGPSLNEFLAFSGNNFSTS